IRRQMDRLPRRKYGGKVKALPLTTTAVKRRTVGAGDIYRRSSGFDTGVLTRHAVKPDESVADRVKRKNRAKRVYKSLATGVQKADSLSERVDNERSQFAKILSEKDAVTGESTQ